MVISEQTTVHRVDEAAVFALAQRLQGEVITPGHETYGGARQLWNAVFQSYPAVIVRAENTADVAEAVRFANEQGLEIAIRSGGHGLAGASTVDDGVVIDLLRMDTVEVNAGARTAWVSGGITSEDLAAQTLPYGLALTTGDVPTVGIGGLATGGGIGWMVRKDGLTIDHLVAAEIVTADGTIVVASAEQHPDLFWAIRGGGGNFGIITKFQFRLDPIGLIYGGMIAVPTTAAVVRGYIELARAAPDELSTQLSLMTAPEAPFVPEEVVGKPIALIIACWSGDIEEGREVLSRFSKLGEGAVIEIVDAMPYSALFDLMREYAPPGMYGSIRVASQDM